MELFGLLLFGVFIGIFINQTYEIYKDDPSSEENWHNFEKRMKEESKDD